MVVSKVHFSVKNLENLLKDKQSCVHLKKFKKHLSLDPSELADTKGSIKAHLNKLISKYDSEMEGVILGFRRMKVTCALGKILNDNPHIHFDVEAEFFIFRPEIGCTLKGIVKKMNNDCIGCLVHDIFNVTIPIKNTNNQIDQQDLDCGQELTFIVDFVDFTNSLPYIKGKLDVSQENTDRCQSPDVEGPGSYVMTTKMKKRKKKQLAQNSASSVSPKESKSVENEHLSDFEYKEKDLSFSSKNYTPKHPISILKKEGSENTPKRLSFYGDIPLSHETVEEEEDTKQTKRPSKVKKAKGKGDSDLELMVNSQGVVNLKRTKKKKEGMIAELDVLDLPESEAASPFNETEVISEKPLTDSSTKKTKKKKQKKTDLNTSVFLDNELSDKVIKDDEEYKSENIDSISFRSREIKGKKIKNIKDGMESVEVRNVENSDGVKLKKLISTKSPGPLSSTPFAKTSGQNLEKKKKNKKDVDYLVLIDNNTNKTKSIKHKSPAEVDMIQVTESINLNDQNTPVVKSKKLRRLSLHDSINEPVGVGEDSPGSAKSKKPKKSSEMPDTPSKFSDQNNLQKSKKKEKNAESVELMDTSKETKSKKRKRTSGLLDIPSDIEPFKLNNQEPKKLETDSCKVTIGLGEQNSEDKKSKKQKRVSELLETISTTGVGFDLEDNIEMGEVSDEHDLKLETRGRNSSKINTGNVNNESSNSPNKKKKRKVGEFQNEADINNVMQINKNKIGSDGNDNSECIGQKKRGSPKKGIGFSSFRTFANSTVIAPSPSERKMSSSSSSNENSLDFPSPIKKGETDTDVLDEIDFFTSTQINPEDCLRKEILPKSSKIVKRERGSAITESEKSTNAKLKFTKENISKLPKKVQIPKNALQSKTPVKTNNSSGAGAAVGPNVNPGKMSSQLLQEFMKKVESIGKSKAQSRDEMESELDSSDPDLPSDFKNLTSLRTKFKSVAESEINPIVSKGSSTKSIDNDSEETDLEDIVPPSQNVSKIEEKVSGLTENDSDEDSAFVSSMKPKAIELGANSPSKKGKRGSGNTGISLTSEPPESKPGKVKNTTPKLKKRKSPAESISNPIMSKGSSKKRMDNNSEEIASEDIVPPSQNLSKIEGKGSRLKRTSKKVQSQDKQPISLSPETISSLANDLLKNI